MKVLFLLNRFPGVGGIENVTTLLARLFETDLGYKTAIFSLESQTDVKIPSCLVDLQIPTKIVNSTLEHVISVEFKQFFNQFQPDVVIFQDSYSEIEYLLTCVKSPVKLIVVEHNSPDCFLKDYLNRYKHHQWFSLSGGVRKLLFPIIYLRILLHQRKRHFSLINRSDKYVVLSESFKELLKEYYCIQSDKIIAIPNVKNDFERFNIKLNLSKRKQVLFIGRLTKQKGVDYLIDIWNIIEHQTQEYELVIIGDGEESKTIESKISEFDLHRVKLIGYREDVYKYYNDSSVLFLTSVYEGFGLVLPEAMQFGVVPFAFNSYMALKDIITDNVDGYTIAPFNIQDYADRFLSFIKKTPEEMLKVRLCAIESSRRFSKDTILSQWKSII